MWISIPTRRHPKMFLSDPDPELEVSDQVPGGGADPELDQKSSKIRDLIISFSGKIAKTVLILFLFFNKRLE
jgi:hypothetical protein